MARITRHGGVSVRPAAVRPVRPVRPAPAVRRPPAGRRKVDVPSVVGRFVEMIDAGDTDKADYLLRHAVHQGAAPSAIARHLAAMTPPEGWTTR